VTPAAAPAHAVLAEQVIKTAVPPAGSEGPMSTTSATPTRGVPCVHTSPRAPQLTVLTATRPGPSPSTPSRAGACSATASSSSTTPASSCPAAAQSRHATPPTFGGRSPPERAAGCPNVLRPAWSGRRWPVGLPHRPVHPQRPAKQRSMMSMRTTARPASGSWQSQAACLDSGPEPFVPISTSLRARAATSGTEGDLHPLRSHGPNGTPGQVPGLRPGREH